MSMFRLADVPMASDRTAGFGCVRAAGDVARAADDGTWLLTSQEAVRFAQHHPELFSAAGAIAGQAANMLPMPPNPDLPRSLIADPTMLGPFIEKTLRFPEKAINAEE